LSGYLILTFSRPSEDAISLVLQDIGKIPAEEVVAFLRAVSHKELKAVLGSTGVHLPIIPTTDGDLKPCSLTYFNDLGPHAGEVPLLPGHSIASDYVDRKLALKLGLSFLSVSMLDDDDLLEMKEDLTTRISNVLLSYTKEQAFTESLANAIDAGATEFGVTLDIIQHPLPANQQFFSPSLKKLCGQPSLILYNNGVFSSSDWKGICSVGSGSKQWNADGKFKIGRFGLGALSMFYFTEVLLTLTIYEYLLISHNFKVAMILSGHYVLFMDPRKEYLGNGRSCYKISLEAMKRYANSISKCTPCIIHTTCQIFPWSPLFTRWPLWFQPFNGGI
jgi:sacsin